VSDDRLPLVMHVLHRFDTGGLENGVVNLINHMPLGAYRHMVVALTDVTDFRSRIKRDDVECLALHKRPGHGARLYPRMAKLMRSRRPAIVHTRNLGPLEMQVPAWLTRVPIRIHGEHGRELDDLDGTSKHHQRLRRLYAPFVGRYVALSRDLAGYLEASVGISPGRVVQIYNGVDSSRFRPAVAEPEAITGCPFAAPRHWLVGSVGRMHGVKDQTTLARAFVRAIHLKPELKDRMRLVLVGEGPLREPSQTILSEAGMRDLAWLPGERDDVPEVMRGLNCFVLPSLAEGVSNTILEAMATGIPVIATGVGGNAELVGHGRTGKIVPAADPDAMAAAIVDMACSTAQAAAMGLEGRAEVERRFSLQAMVSAYQALYDRQLAAAGIERRN
jgi:sugar transferase (PEP-CTERM/EpsH1 system associated)